MAAEVGPATPNGGDDDVCMPLTAHCRPRSCMQRVTRPVGLQMAPTALRAEPWTSCCRQRRSLNFTVFYFHEIPLSACPRV
jgi:hypothetical protein